MADTTITSKYLNSVCAIKTQKNEVLATGKLGKIAEDYMDILDPTGDLPILHYSDVVKMDIHNDRLGFKVLMGTVYISTKSMLRIARPVSMAEFDKRVYFRVKATEKVSVFIPSQLDTTNTDEGDVANMMIVDLSLGGIQILTDRGLRPGDTIYPILKLFGKEMPLRCLVKRRITQDLENKNGYGCVFVEVTEKQKDLLYKYIIKKEAEQRPKKWD